MRTRCCISENADGYKEQQKKEGLLMLSLFLRYGTRSWNHFLVFNEHCAEISNSVYLRTDQKLSTGQQWHKEYSSTRHQSEYLRNCDPLYALSRILPYSRSRKVGGYIFRLAVTFPESNARNIAIRLGQCKKSKYRKKKETSKQKGSPEMEYRHASRNRSPFGRKARINGVYGFGGGYLSSRQYFMKSQL